MSTKYPLIFRLSALMLLYTGFSYAADLVHLFEFKSDLLDSSGNSELISNGGSVEKDSYVFNENEGLILDTRAVTSDNFSIGFQFQLTNLVDWAKLIDFKNRTSDQGQYIFQSVLITPPI